MQNAEKKMYPTYLEGGVPGALAVLMFIIGILSILAGMAELVAGGVLLFNQQIVGGLELMAAPVALVPTIMAGFGALRLRRGSAAGAGVIAAACAFRRVLIIIGICAISLVGTISAIGIFAAGKSGAFLVFLLTSAIYALAVVLFVFLLKMYNRLREMMSLVQTETAEWRPLNLRGYRPPIGWTIFVTVICCISTVSLILYPNSGILNRLYLNGAAIAASLQYWMRSIAVMTFLTAAQYLMTAIFCQAFVRAHQSDNPEESMFRPAGYAKVTASGVIGTILLSWLVLMTILNIITYVAYPYVAIGGTWLSILNEVCLIVSLTLLAISLLHRCRALLTVLGAVFGIVNVAILLIRYIPKIDEINFYFFIWLAYVATYAIFFVLLLIAGIMSMSRKGPAPRGLRIAMMIIGLGHGAFAFVYNGMNYYWGIPVIFAAIIAAVFAGAVIALSMAPRKAPDRKRALPETIPQVLPDPRPAPAVAPESLLDRAVREQRTPVRLRSAKSERVQARLAAAEAGAVCTAELVEREGRAPVWKVTGPGGMLGSLREDEYTEGRTIVLAKVVTKEDDEEYPRRAYVYVM